MPKHWHYVHAILMWHSSAQARNAWPAHSRCLDTCANLRLHLCPGLGANKGPLGVGHHRWYSGLARLYGWLAECLFEWRKTCISGRCSGDSHKSGHDCNVLFRPKIETTAWHKIAPKPKSTKRNGRDQAKCWTRPAAGNEEANANARSAWTWPKKRRGWRNHCPKTMQRPLQANILLSSVSSSCYSLHCFFFCFCFSFMLGASYETNNFDSVGNLTL